eukprot:g10776.t1
MPCILRWRFDWEMLILPGVEDWLGEEGRAKRCFKRRVPRGAPCSPVQGLSLHSNQRSGSKPRVNRRRSKSMFITEPPIGLREEGGQLFDGGQHSLATTWIV